MSKSIVGLAAMTMTFCLAVSGVARAADTVMQQCGQQYQAAKAGGTLNGQSWNQFRVACAAKLKAQPASATTTPPALAPAVAPVPAPAATPAPPPAPAPTTVASPLKPATPPPAPSAAATPPAAAPATPPATGGRAAMLAREKQCGAEWRANKVTLVAQTPGLTWPKYWSQCNTRLKAAGQ